MWRVMKNASMNVAQVMRYLMASDERRGRKKSASHYRIAFALSSHSLSLSFVSLLTGLLSFLRLLTRWGKVKQQKIRGEVNCHRIQEKRPTCVEGLFDRSSKAFGSWCQGWSSGRRSQLLTSRSFEFLHPIATHDQCNSIVSCTRCFIDDTAVSKWGKRKREAAEARESNKRDLQTSRAVKYFCFNRSSS